MATTYPEKAENRFPSDEASYPTHRILHTLTSYEVYIKKKRILEQLLHVASKPGHIQLNLGFFSVRFYETVFLLTSSSISIPAVNKHHDSVHGYLNWRLLSKCTFPALLQHRHDRFQSPVASRLIPQTPQIRH